MGRRLSDPDWKSGPTYPEPTSSDHDIWSDEPSGEDFDGFGVNEAKSVDGEPLLAIQEVHNCGRDGCDAQLMRRHLFTTEDLTPTEEVALRGVAGDSVELMANYVFENAERIDIDAIEVPLEEGTLIINAEQCIEDAPRGDCFGHKEPEPDIDAYRYDL